MSYGVDVCNRFACLLVEPTPDDCADPTIRSNIPDSSCMNSSCLTPQLSPCPDLMIMLILPLGLIFLTPVALILAALHLSYLLLYPSVPIQAWFPVPMALTLLFWWFPRLRTLVTSFKKFCLPPVQTKPSLPSDDASSGVCETVAPPDNLKDLCFTFNNLSSCNLSNMVEQFSESVGDIYLPWVAVYLVERAYIEPNLHTLYLHFLHHLADSSVNTP